MGVHVEGRTVLGGVQEDHDVAIGETTHAGGAREPVILEGQELVPAAVREALAGHVVRPRSSPQRSTGAAPHRAPPQPRPRHRRRCDQRRRRLRLSDLAAVRFELQPIDATRLDQDQSGKPGRTLRLEHLGLDCDLPATVADVNQRLGQACRSRC